jgi:cobalt/nickel transport system ATP-binding protein
VIEIVNLSVEYGVSGQRSALSEVNLAIAAAERVALIGANGAGKSTLLLAICGAIPASSGSVSIDGLPWTKREKDNPHGKAGLVFQNPDDQLFMPTVYEDIAFGLRSNNVSVVETDKRMEEMLTRLEIAHLKDRMCHTLSGGEKRLAALAGVLVMRPDYLLLDEPASFLDPRAKRRFVALLDSLAQGFILATHDMDIAARLCSRVIILKEGKVFADGGTGLLDNEALMDQAGL